MSKFKQKLILLVLSITVLTSIMTSLLVVKFLGSNSQLTQQVAALTVSSTSLTNWLFQLSNCNPPITGFANGAFINGVARLDVCPRR
jgi:hypothetical protein